eukprot:gene15984-biopygen3716
MLRRRAATACCDCALRLHAATARCDCMLRLRVVTALCDGALRLHAATARGDCMLLRRAATACCNCALRLHVATARLMLRRLASCNRTLARSPPLGFVDCQQRPFDNSARRQDHSSISQPPHLNSSRREFTEIS